MLKYSREFAMPNAETFSIKPIKKFVHRYTYGDKVIVDPFARNSKMGTITNDLNPETDAQYQRIESFNETAFPWFICGNGRYSAV